MNQNELRYQEKMDKKVLNYLTKSLEALMDLNGNLTGADQMANAAVQRQDQELILALSKERRAVLRRLNRGTRITDSTEE